MQYDLVVVVDPREDEKKTEEKLTHTLEKEGFIILEKASWGKKPLAYPIKKRTEGLYFNIQMTSQTGTPPAKLNAKFKLDDTILRSLVLKEEKAKKKNPKS